MPARPPRLSDPRALPSEDSCSTARNGRMWVGERKCPAGYPALSTCRLLQSSAAGHWAIVGRELAQQDAGILVWL
jgi:hypothetical protein